MEMKALEALVCFGSERHRYGSCFPQLPEGNVSIKVPAICRFLRLLLETSGVDFGVLTGRCRGSCRSRLRSHRVKRRCFASKCPADKTQSMPVSRQESWGLPSHQARNHRVAGVHLRQGQVSSVAMLRESRPVACKEVLFPGSRCSQR